MTYNDRLNAGEQVSAEEWIAAYLFEHGIDLDRGQAESMSEEYCQKIAKPILLEVLTRFRPDLFADPIEGLEDEDLTADQLRAKYDALENYSRWASHPTYSMADWRDSVLQDDTRLGYWEWVQHQIEMVKEGKSA